MKLSKERKELLAKLGKEVYDLISEMTEKNGLNNGEVVDMCVNVTSAVIGMILSKSGHNLDGVLEEIAELYAGDLGRGIIRSYSLCEAKKKYDEVRDNTSKDPA